MSDVRIPDELRPADGHFGSGPSKIRAESLAALAAQTDYMGTSHRQAPVRQMVGRIKEGLRVLFSLPEGYEAMFGNGGTTAFWDALVFGMIEHRSQHLVFGEFSSKFATAARTAPFLNEPDVIESEPGTHPVFAPDGAVDFYALCQNETSTGVAMPVLRPVPRAFVGVDATSAAGGLRVDPAEFDVYYFAPQKGFASDGGLWIALCSPAAIERIEQIAGSDRFIPASLNLKTALDNSRKDQTYNTPALATLFLMAEQIDWINGNGGLEWSASRSDKSAEVLYGWAEASSYASPFVSQPEQRSRVVGTIDLDDGVDAAAVSSVLRANGIVDTEPYRKLGRNQLRIAMYPAIDPEDIHQLTRCIDYVVDAADASATAV